MAFLSQIFPLAYRMQQNLRRQGLFQPILLRRALLLRVDFEFWGLFRRHQYFVWTHMRHHLLRNLLETSSRIFKIIEIIAWLGRRALISGVVLSLYSLLLIFASWVIRWRSLCFTQTLFGVLPWGFDIFDYLILLQNLWGVLAHSHVLML